MYKHIVFWKIRDEVDGVKKADLVQSVIEQLESLPEAIPEIKTYEVGSNIGEYEASFYDICLISTFENKDTFWKYTKYPVHDDVVAFIQSVQEDEQIVDFEV